MHSVFSKEQVEKIRSEMFLVYSKKQIKYGKHNFSYEKLGMEVSDEFHNRNEDKSVLGKKYRYIEEVYISTTDSGGRSDNFRKFLTKKSDRMEDLKLYACLIYLTNPANKFSSLTMCSFESETPSQDLPILLSKFMNPDGKGEMLKVKETFFPSYSTTKGDGLFRLTMDHVDEHYQYSSNLYIENRRGSCRRHFTGWTVISNNDVITMYLKDAGTDEPLLLNAIAMSESLYGSKPISCLTLVPISEPLVLETQLDITSIFNAHYDKAEKKVLSLSRDCSVYSEEVQ